MAIRTEQGRSRSVRTPEEVRATLEEELRHLNPDERVALEILLKEVAQTAGATEPQDQTPTLLGALGQFEYAETPVDMETFIRDPYYLGTTCETMYPVLLKDLEELFAGGYHEAIWSGAIGYGKSFVASAGICRVLYELSCLKNPHQSFGLAPGSNISIVCMSVNETLAVKVVFENIVSKIKASPYFQERFPFEDTKKELRFPGGIWVAARASTDTSSLGLNTVSAFLDETNFLPKNEKDEKYNIVDRAETIYNAIQRRMKSRFERFGKLPGMIFIVSSKKTVDDFTERRIREAKNDPTVFVREYALWETKPEEYYSSKRFWVMSGNESVPSRILDDAEYLELKAIAPEGVTFVHVPEDFRRDFERDIEGALRDLAGIATVSINPFIHRRDKIGSAIDPKRRHPFSTLVYDHSQGGQFCWERMVRMSVERGFGDVPMNVQRPLINPQAPRHVHIDPALRNDAAGFCMSHVGGWKDVSRRTEDGREYMEHAPIYIVDVLLRIVPPLGDEIVLGEIRHLVYDLAAHGYMIVGVTMDSWNSADSIQQFNQRGYRSQILSVDTSTEPYENLKMALYEDRVHYYEYTPLLEELQHLERRYDGKRSKIDHPPHGRKDVADALAACCFALNVRQSDQPLPMVRGVSYNGDAWLDEQRQAVLAGNPAAAINSDILPPFLGGGGGRYGGGGSDGSGGGWFPG